MRLLEIGDGHLRILLLPRLITFDKQTKIGVNAT